MTLSGRANAVLIEHLENRKLHDKLSAIWREVDEQSWMFMELLKVSAVSLNRITPKFEGSV